MNTTVNQLSPTKVKLVISLDKSELAAAEQVALSKLAKTMKVPGFRKGKVPASIAAKHADPGALAQQAADDAISKAVAEAFLSENLQALARPEVEITKFVPGEELEFTAETEVLPEVKLGDYKKLGVKINPIAVKESDVAEILDRMREGMSQKQLADRAAKTGDEVVIDFIGKKADVAFEGGTANDYELKLGSNSFIPGFEEALIGKKAGDKEDVKLTFPADYHVAELAGEDVVFETTIKSVNEIALPKLDDDFAKKADPQFETLKEFKADIKRELKDQKDREAGEKLKDDLVTKLVDVSTIAAPQVLVDDQMRSIEQDMTQNLMYQNISLEQYMTTQKFKDKDEWLEKEVKPAAAKRVQAGLALAELSKVLKVEATADELADHINKYREQYKTNPDALKQFEQPEVQRDIANRLLTEKTVDQLVDLNK